MNHSQHSQNSITIDDGVTHVEQSMFENPSSITSITLPNSVTAIGRYAFSRCTGLTQLPFKACDEHW